MHDFEQPAAALIMGPVRFRVPLVGAIGLHPVQILEREHID